MKKFLMLTALLVSVFFTQHSAAADASSKTVLVSGYFTECLGRYGEDEDLCVYRFYFTSSFRDSRQGNKTAYVEVPKYIYKNESYLNFLVDKTYFDEHFSYETDYAIKAKVSELYCDVSGFATSSDALKSVKLLELQNDGEYLPYCSAEGLYDDNEYELKGYFAEELEEYPFVNELLKDTYVYRFHILEIVSDYSNKFDDNDKAYSKQYENDDIYIGYDMGYQISIYPTDFNYDGNHVFTLFHYPSLSYLEFDFDVFEKEELIEEAKEAKKENIKRDFTPLFVVVGAIVICGGSAWILKKKTKK